MNRQTVEAVRDLAAAVAQLCTAVLDEESRRQATADNGFGAFGSVFYGSKETGALRRKSMDLTRALAEMRRS